MGYFAPVIYGYLARYATTINGRMLDVGCGTAPYRALFSGVSQYIGLDRPSEPYKDYGLNDKRNAATNVIGDAYQLPFCSGHFDAVVGFQIFEHLAEPLSFLQEARRVLHDGGDIILTFPLINPIHEAPYDYFRYTEYGLRHLCEVAKLQVVEVLAMGGGWLTVGYLLRSLILRDELIERPPWWRRWFAHKIYALFTRYDRSHPCPEWTLNYIALIKKL